MVLLKYVGILPKGHNIHSRQRPSALSILKFGGFEGCKLGATGPVQCERRMDVGSAKVSSNASECYGRLTWALPSLSVRSAWFALEIVNADQDLYSGYFELKH